MRWLPIVAATALAFAGCSSDGTSTESSTSDITDAAVEPTDAPTTTTGATAVTTDAPVTVPEPPSDEVEADLIPEPYRNAEPPWLSGSAFEDPFAAAESFMEWLRPRVLDSWTLDPWPTDYATFAETSYTADVTVRFSPVRNNVTVDQAVQPTMEIGLARANLSEGWTVSRARSPALHVGTPVHIGISVGKFPQASIGSAFELDYFNALTGDPAELRIFVAGSDKPVFQAQTNGGGIFASGLHSGVVDMTQCTPEGNLPEGSMPLLSDVYVCEGPGPDDEYGTLVIGTEYGATTVPIAFE